MKMKRILVAAALAAAITTAPAAASEITVWKAISVQEAANVFGGDEPAVQWAFKVGARCYVGRASGNTPVAAGVFRVLQCFAQGYTGDSPQVEDYTTARFDKN